MSLHPKDKQAAIVAAAIIFNRKVDNYKEAGSFPSVADMARDAAAEAVVLVYAVEKHMAPKARR